MNCWLSVTLTVAADSVEALSDALLEAGAVSVDVTDAWSGTPREHAMFGEPGAPQLPAWEESEVRALFGESEDVSAMVAQALRTADLDPARSYVVDRIADQDWVRATQSQFQPVQVSSRLWVVPSWHVPPDPKAINLVIDPGLAFGTGTHPTTRLCLNWLEANLRAGQSVLDYGCGSGILAIAAARLGAAAVTGVDIDAAALLAANGNAMQNQVDVRFASADQAAPAVHEIVLANILANPLKLLAPLLASATASGGRIALSGILEHQAEEVREPYRNWFVMDETQQSEGWVLLSGVRL